MVLCYPGQYVAVLDMYGIQTTSVGGLAQSGFNLNQLNNYNMNIPFGHNQFELIHIQCTLFSSCRHVLRHLLA